MGKEPFIIYKSSAGSGKTYTLTMEYLRLALANPTAFKSILAVTFTNKATKEMKERILQELARLKHTVHPANKMDSELLAEFNLTPDQLKPKAAAALSAILHDYASFSVSTIDSFFQKVVRAFAREIDLQAKFDVELDQEAVLERVVDRMILKVTEDEYLHRWVVAFASEQIQEGKSWDIRKNIKLLGKQLFQEDFKRNYFEIKNFLKDKQQMEALQRHIQQNRALVLEQCREMKGLANRIRENNGLDWTDFKGGSRSFAHHFDKLGEKAKPIPDLAPTHKALIGNCEGWFSKACPKKEAIERAYADGLGNILEQFLPLTYQWNTIEALRKNFYVFGIFRNLLEELSALKEEENILLISDANEFLKGITEENETPFIYEKIGNQYRHFLIDEFQDTSGFQWASFRPLLINSLAQGFTNLLVGDVKQSIYRWRGGEMKLLLEKVEQETGQFGISIRNLDTNFRSLPNIILFNNALFSLLPAQLEKVLREEFQVSQTEIIPKAYTDVGQKVSPTKSQSEFRGKVRIEFVEEMDDELGKFKDQVVSRIPGMIMELQDKGYKLKDLAVLVRNKREGQEIADALMAQSLNTTDNNYRFDVLSEEAMFLEKSASVRCLLSALRYLFDPEDQVHYNAMWYYWTAIFGYPINHELFGDEKTPAFLMPKVDQFEALKPKLLKMPLLEMLEAVIDVLALNPTGLELAYISGFKEAIYDFVTKNRADLAGFLVWWEDHKEKRTVKIPEGHDAIRILTIHKSKGLQFKVVLMPFMDWRIFDSNKDNVVWTPFQIRETGMATVIPLTLGKTLALSAFKETYEEEAVLAYLDTLNLVYVALTRAEEIFWGLCPFKPGNKNRSMNNLSVNLLEVIEKAGGATKSPIFRYYDPVIRVFDLGDWNEPVESVKEKQEFFPLRWEYRHWGQLLQVKKYVGDFTNEGLEIRNKRNYGLLVHAVLETAKNQQEVSDRLEELYFEGSVNMAERNRIEEQLKNLFQIEKFQSWFDGKGEILAEQGILIPGGNQKRPDRIIIFPDGISVVDFKTGEERSSNVAQVKEYMALVTHLSDLPVTGYICYLEKGEILEIN